MKAVEIEFLMQNNAETGLKKLAADLNTIQHNATQAQTAVAALKQTGNSQHAQTSDSYSKQREQAEAVYQQELERIKQQMQQRLALNEKLRQSGRPAPENDLIIHADGWAQQINATVQRDNTLTAIDNQEAIDNRQRFEALLKPYQEYTLKREEIERKHNQIIENLRNDLTVQPANREAIHRALGDVQAAKDTELNSLNNTFVDTIKKNSRELTALFSTTSKQTKSEMEAAILYAQKLYTLLTDTKSDSTSNLVSGAQPEGDLLRFSSDQLASMQQNADFIKTLLQGIIDKKDQLYSKGGSAKQFISSFKQIRDALKLTDEDRSKEELNKGISNMATKGQEVNKVFGDIAGKLTQIAELSGDEQLASFASSLQNVSDTMSSVFQGAAAGLALGGESGGPIGAAIGAGVGGLLSIFTLSATAEARHSAALKKIESAKLSFQRQYNLLLIKQNLLLEEASNVFGIRQITKAATAMQTYKNTMQQYMEQIAGTPAEALRYQKLANSPLDALFGGQFAQKAEDYKRGIGRLADAQIVTGHEKTGLFGWGKGRDVYSRMIDVYPELIAANGELDAEMLQVILDTRQMSDETRAYLQNILALKAAMDEAEQALEQYLQQTFGSLGQGMLDSIIEALKGGDEAMEAFADKAATIFEQLGEQVAYSLFFADKFDRLQTQLKDVYGSGKSDDQIAADAMNLIDSFYNNIGTNVDAAQQWMEQWRKRAEEMGYDIWSEDGEATTQRGRTGAFQALSQEQGTLLEGLMTSLQIHAASLDQKTDNITAGLGGCLESIRHIAVNTDALPQMLMLWQTIKRDGLKIQ